MHSHYTWNLAKPKSRKIDVKLEWNILVRSTYGEPTQERKKTKYSANYQLINIITSISREMFVPNLSYIFSHPFLWSENRVMKSVFGFAFGEYCTHFRTQHFYLLNGNWTADERKSHHRKYFATTFSSHAKYNKIDTSKTIAVVIAFTFIILSILLGTMRSFQRRRYCDFMPHARCKPTANRQNSTSRFDCRPFAWSVATDTYAYRIFVALMTEARGNKFDSQMRYTESSEWYFMWYMYLSERVRQVKKKPTTLLAYASA